MRTALLASTCGLLASITTTPAWATGSQHSAHGVDGFHAFSLETGFGATSDGQGTTDWDFDGWIGNDNHKLVLISEGEQENGVTHEAEFWGMYGHNLSAFWDAQIGLRHDTQPESTSYAVFGFEGVAPFFIETAAHIFVSEDGDVGVRLNQGRDFLLTQKIITQPYLEANIFMQDVPDLEVGAGLTDLQLGVQTRYEITKAIAPYIDLEYTRKFGETSSIAKEEGGDNDSFVGTIGLRLLF